MPVPLIVAAWLALGVAVSGVGLLAGRVLRLQVGSSLSLTFWLGLAATIGALNGACLVRPVDGWTSAGFLVAAAFGFIVAGDDRTRWFQRLKNQRAVLLVLLAASVPLAWIATTPPRNADAYLYHLHAIAWAEAYPALPGLGNLHGRLAFNNASSLLFALFDHGPLAGKVCHFANGLFLLPIIGRGLRGIGRLVRGSGSTTRDALDAVLLAGAVDWALGPNISSASPDLLVACLQAAIASELAGALLVTGAFPSVVAILGAALLTVKLSAVGFVIGLAGVLLIVARNQPRIDWKRCATAAAVIVAAWLIRGIMLSGYPLYPSDLFGFPLDWRIPLDRVHEEAGYALGWGRRAGVPWREVMASSDWILPWAKSMLLLNREVVVPLATAFAFLVAAVSRRDGSTPVRLVGAAMFAPPLVELAWWLATSPDPRFAGACFWLLPAVAAAMLMVRRGGDRITSASLAAICALLAAWPLGASWELGGPMASAPAEPPRAIVRVFTTRSGLAVSVPEAGSNCTGYPLVCTPFPDPDLGLRRPGDTSGGFKVSRPSSP